MGKLITVTSHIKRNIRRTPGVSKNLDAELESSPNLLRIEDTEVTPKTT